MIESAVFFWVYCVFVGMLFIIGLYCIFMTYNLVRALIGLELLIKAATLLIIAAGFTSRHIALAQAFVITLIVVEVVFIAVAVGVVLGLFRHNRSIDAREIKALKG